MNFIDLLDDSDDDIPLRPSKNYGKPSTAATQFAPKEEMIELSSSDDDEPILKRSKTSPVIRENCTLKFTTRAGYDSDKTERYDSGSTEKYWSSDDSFSLPDISLSHGKPSADCESRISSSEQQLSTEICNSTADSRNKSNNEKQKHVPSQSSSSQEQSSDVAQFTHIKASVSTVNYYMTIISLFSLHLLPKANNNVERCKQRLILMI